MNIAINQDVLQNDKHTGLYQYVSNTIAHLPLNSKDNLYYFTSINNKNLRFNDIANEYTKYLGISHNDLINLAYFYSIGNNIQQNKNNIDIYWGPTMLLPFFMSKYKIVTIEDLIPLKQNSEILLSKNKKMLSMFNYLTKKQIKKQDIITTISDSVKNEILTMFNKIDPDKIKVIYPQFDHIEINISKSRINLIKNKYGIKNDYIFTLYSITPRKNIISIVQQYNNTPSDFQHNYSLVIGGRKSNNYEQTFIELNNEISKNKYGQIVLLDYIPQNDISVIYQGQILFVSQSLDEGFDMPAVEQLRSNISVIQSDIPVHKEMMGNLQLYFPPLDILTIQGEMQYKINRQKYFYTPDTYLFKYRYTWDDVGKEYLKLFYK